MNDQRKPVPADELLVMKKAARTVSKNFSVILTVISLVALLALTFVDVNAQTIFTLKFAVKLILYIAIYYTIFFSMQGSGLQDGHVQDVYIDSSRKYSEIRESIRSEHEIEDLQEFCDYYIETELKNARTKVLRAVSIPYSLFEEKWLNADKLEFPKGFPIKKRIAIKKAKELHPVRLTPDMLLNSGSLHSARSPLGLSPGKKLATRDFVSMVPRTVIIFLVVDVTVTVISNPSWETVIEGLLKAFCGLLCAHQGYSTGFNNIVNDTVEFLDRQINILSQYTIWLEKKSSQNDINV